MKSLVFSLFDESGLANKIAEKLTILHGKCEIRHFPDQETYLRISSEAI